ncbi:galactosylgalactosylxylosylprotein 3-beta-glucuronosyltransferase 1-like isoform X7 [Salvelinus fontinalis]|uniref:galactosylgalactosylxylosylprotein 3-beta-glucuronosyltransferase 1-like isoform X7 n=1 Tax=Salvelinus fontinalis TaxID=8038 RepID=UPI00248585E3|nr:galactosylgalactosylxylosylprotein 3-beta-glucuronosyltransferase 1-like isoform X7 [Salvelinus fontinalis]
MPKRRDILAIVLIVLPWTLLITVWHQSAITPLLAARKCKGHSSISPCRGFYDDRHESRRDSRNTFTLKASCTSENSKDIVEVVRTEYVYSRQPPWSDVLPTLHVVTPTYSRPVQKAELTRLANTLLHVPNLHWILVEDSQRKTPLVTRLLQETGLNYTHLNVETPRNYKLRGDMRDPRIPRGTMQRNLALRWLRETFNSNNSNSQPGIVYFADDDNTYSLDLFEEPQAYFKLRGVKGGYQESSLLRELVTLSDLEPKAANCTKVIYGWDSKQTDKRQAPGKQDQGEIYIYCNTTVKGVRQPYCLLQALHSYVSIQA